MLRDKSLIPLSREHHHALALCVRVDRALGGDPNLASLARAIVSQFDSEMRAHFEAEERALFPTMALFESTAELTARLTAEHRRMTDVVDQLRHGAARETLEDFTDLLRAHVRAEENLLFQEAQRLLSREQLDEIAARLEKHPGV